MLARLHEQLENGCLPIIAKTVNGEDVSHMGAFSLGSVLDFSVKCSRRLGIRAVVLRIARDGEEAKDIPLSFFVLYNKNYTL